jgi:hypothetical protein
MPKGKPTKVKVLPEWYPLAVYSQKLTKAQWLDEIVVRMAMRITKDNEDEGLIPKESSQEHQNRFRNVIVTQKSRDPKALEKARDKDFWPVRHPKPFELHYLAEIERHPSYANGREWARKLANGPFQLHKEFALKHHDDVMAVPFVERGEDLTNRLMDVMHRRIPVLVDLDHDDHTLQLAFKVWLAGARDSISEKARKPIGDKEFARWTKFGLLPAFDLLFWARITGQPCTDVFIAHTLWPDNRAASDDFADITERFRKVTRPMVDEIFGWPYVAKLWAQVDFERSLDELVARDKRNKTEGKTVPESAKVIKHPRANHAKEPRRK